jgi:hypothetical protein
LPLA